ncbi:MAG: primosomal protein N' [Acidaminococcaceae bacterium]|nr:primosomal protein N' [Acidaminococcaceae bacterium]MDD4721549.1 primosomal protein N' [Acidaminococcaceae bacterium]
MKFAQVAINLPVKNIFQQFTYKVPEQLDFLAEGWRVVVPFGKQLLEGFIVGEERQVDMTLNYKEIVDTLGTEPWFNEEMLTTAHWMADYYMCSLAEVLRLFIPGKKSIVTVARYVASEECAADLTNYEQELYVYLQINGPMLRKDIVALEKGAQALKGLITKKAVCLDYEIKQKIKNKSINIYTITDAGKEALLIGNKRIKAQMAALSILQAGNKLTAAEFAKHKISPGTIRTLVLKKWAEKSEERILRDSYRAQGERKEILQLTDEQKTAITTIGVPITEGKYQTFLLQGITGSGKTEVYLRLAEKAVAAGKQAMVLVPEIALTGQIIKRFKSWFGNKVAVAHSKLSPGERADVWQRMHSGQADILIGVRSAVFSPFAHLGLIILDEEHEYTYKQEERPNYHARKVALERAELAQVPVVLGSATPDLESYYKAQNNEYTYLQLTKRPMTGGRLPAVEIVDMRAELQSGNKSVLSRPLRKALTETVQAGEQAIILLNRRGFSTFVMCRDCGETITCPNCAVALVYHAKEKLMRCHYCGHTAPIPDECPKCHSRRIKFFGTGTEKAEGELQALGENIRPIRMDQDSTTAKFAHEDILQSFINGSYNVLLGTQMVAKGHDIPNVTLVGVLSADSQLNLPDFRSGERTFALLTQAAGRAGRGEKHGSVIFQAYDADNSVLKMAATQDYAGFAQVELEARKELGYPPYTDLLKITVLHKAQNLGNAIAQRIVNFLEAQCLAQKDNSTQIMGPFPAIVAMVNNIYRINILIKSTNMVVVKQILMSSEFKAVKNIYFDVDPVSVI